MRKMSYFIIFVLFASAAFFAFKNWATVKTQAFSMDDYSVLLQEPEKAGNPITLRYDGNYYYYVPFTINDSIPGTFPGVILDSDAGFITDKNILKELYKYPALVGRFASNVASFDKLAVKKVAAFAQYCGILEVQAIRGRELNLQANVPGVIYNGIKLAFDAVGLVKSAVTGGAKAAVKELAKGKVQDAVTSMFSSADSRAIIESAQKTDSSAKGAYESCKAALEAWNSSVSTTGKASPEYALDATEQAMMMFSQETMFVKAVSESLQRINNYPKIITKIKKSNYNAAVKNLEMLAKKLNAESQYWAMEMESANDENTLDLWVNGLLDRVRNAEAQVVEPPPAPASCSAVDVANDYTIYTYTVNTPGGNGPCTSFGNSASGSTVTLACTRNNRFRNHWVKKVSTNGQSKIKVKANLTIVDRGFFYSICPSGGVKYDDYSALYVMSTDPRPTLDAECNKTVSDADWPKCGIDPTATSVIGKCGVLKCSPSQTCEFEVNTTGLSDVYLVFRTANPWPAYVTGTLSGVEVCPAE